MAGTMITGETVRYWHPVRGGWRTGKLVGFLATKGGELAEIRDLSGGRKIRIPVEDVQSAMVANQVEK
jgi:hypothetical protein